MKRIMIFSVAASIALILTAWGSNNSSASSAISQNAGWATDTIVVEIPEGIDAQGEGYALKTATPAGNTLYFNWINDDQELQFAEYKEEKPGNLIIPQCVNFEGKTFTVTSIDEYAFSDVKHLRSVIIPTSVTEIKQWAFSNCHGLRELIVAEGNPVYDSREGCDAVIETKTGKLIAGSLGTVIPSGVVRIANGAFSGLTDLTKINIPQNVSYIEDNAFSGCVSLSFIECSAVFPPKCEEYSFVDVPLDCHVVVPHGSKGDYKRAPVWRYFKNIEDR